MTPQELADAYEEMELEDREEFARLMDVIDEGDEDDFEDEDEDDFDEDEDDFDGDEDDE